MRRSNISASDAAFVYRFKKGKYRHRTYCPITSKPIKGKRWKMKPALERVPVRTIAP